MDKNQLRQELENFNEKLNSKQNIDSNLKESLKKLMDDVSGYLENSDAVSEEEKESLMKNLKDTTVNFEAEHPGLSESIKIIVHTLSNMGI